jgi:hypothetical protein
MNKNTDLYLEVYNYLNNKKNIFDNNNENNIIKHINELIKLLEENIRINCEHHYENDYIDISLDRSQKICYCKKCLLTF